MPDHDVRVQSACPESEMPMVLHARVVTGSGGGPDKTILNSPRALQGVGYQSKCLFLRPVNDRGFQALRDRAAEWHAPIIEIDDRGPLDWRIVPQALKICKAHRTKIWHAHDYKTNLLGLVLCRWWPMRLVTTVHGWVEMTPRTRVYHQLDRWILPKYDRVIGVSPDLLATCRGFGVCEEKSLLIENAIDIEQFRRSRSQAEAKRALGIPENQLLIGAVGRLSPEKGFDRLINAVAELHATGREPRLAILGDGDQRDYLQTLIDRSGLNSHLRLIGFQSNPTAWYEAMDVYALSSLREGLPNVVLEAMALGTPVVATRVAGVPRLIEDGESGLIVPIGDHAALTFALAKLLDDESLRGRLARSARGVIESRYSFSARMNKMAAVYDSLGVAPRPEPASLV